MSITAIPGGIVENITRSLTAMVLAVLAAAVYVLGAAFRVAAYASVRSVSPATSQSLIRTSEWCRQVTESVGGSLECSYWMLGDYDGLPIVDLPDTLTAAAVSMALSGSGAFSRYETRELIPPGDYRAIAERAQAINFRPPGA